MLNPEGTPVFFDPAPCDPEIVLATLSTSTLVELEGALHDPARSRMDNPWLQAVALERSKRIRATRVLKTLEKYHSPQAESPAYDAEAGPAAYLELARDANCEAGMALELTGEGMEEKHSINELIRSYVESKFGKDANGGTLSSMDAEGFADFLKRNAQGILLGPLSAATLSYRQAKDAFIRDRVTELVPGKGELRYKLHNLKREKLEKLRIDLENLPYRSPVPDFYRIQRVHQDDILEIIISECMELRELLSGLEPELIRATAGRMPLAYHSVAELRQAVAESSLLSPVEVCRIFLEQPQGFWKVLAEANKTAEAKRELEAEEVKRRRKLEELAALMSELADRQARKLENISIVERLLDDPDVKEEVLDAEPGSAVAVTEPDRIISAPKFDNILAKHVELIGRALWENTERPNPNGLHLMGWDMFNVGQALRGDYEGNLRNLRITYLGVTQEELEEALDNYEPTKTPAADALRLIIEAEMKPTGRPAEPVYLTLLLLIHKSKLRDGLHKSRQGTHTTGPATALRLGLRARATGQIIESRAVRRPLRGGLPGLRRRR